MSNSGFEEGVVYESREVSEDVFLVTKVVPVNNGFCDSVHFIWLSSNAPYLDGVLGHERCFEPDSRSFEFYKRVF